MFSCFLNCHTAWFNCYQRPRIGVVSEFRDPSAGNCCWLNIKYLGRYTHKVAISNHRIKEVNDKEVTFCYKDYKTGGSNKQMTLCNHEFVRRFCQHILPNRFVRIRHYGILSSNWKRGRLQALQKELKVYTAGKPVKTLLHSCPCCKTGTLITIEFFSQRGPPGKYLRAKQPVPVG